VLLERPNQFEELTKHLSSNAVQLIAGEVILSVMRKNRKLSELLIFACLAWFLVTAVRYLVKFTRWVVSKVRTMAASRRSA